MFCGRMSRIRLLGLLAISIFLFLMVEMLYPIRRPTDGDVLVCPLGQFKDDAMTQSEIPQRLHQIFKNKDIPPPYHEHIKSWRKINPTWQYFFWTDSSFEQMLKDKYPDYVALYKSYNHRLQRSDAMRYFILHQYGGVYSDLDVQALKPMDSYLNKKTCVVVPEPTVQTNLIFNLDSALTNCIMAGTAKHPFLDTILRSLPGAYRKVTHNWDVLHSTGPFFLNRTHIEYTKQYPHCRPGDPCHVHVADHKLLVPTIDVPDLKSNAENICKDPKRGQLQEKACQHLTKSNFANDVPVEALTNHLWLHLGWNPKKFKSADDICKLVPEAITYDSITSNAQAAGG